MFQIRILIALALLLADPASAEPPPVSVAPPPGLNEPEMRLLWDEALVFENEGRFPEAIARLESLQRSVPGSSIVHWRVARMYWRAGEGLAGDDKRGRLEAFQPRTPGLLTVHVPIWPPPRTDAGTGTDAARRP